MSVDSFVRGGTESCMSIKVEYFNGFLHTEEGLFTRNVCVFLTILTRFAIYFYISPIS